MATSPRLLCVGLDSMDPDLIREGAREGWLPTFAALFESAAFAPTINPPGLYIGALWPSFATALSPVRHGRYCYAQLDAGTYRPRPIRARDVKGTPFWAALDRAGRRVAVFDVPKVPAIEGFGGAQLV